MAERFCEAALATDPGSYRAGVASPSLLLEQVGQLSVDYAPFDHIEGGAQLAIVGLTPGRQQAANAISAMIGLNSTTSGVM